MSQNNSPPDGPATMFTNMSMLELAIEDKLKTQDLLQASSGVVAIIEKFGKVFSPVVYDMNGNIKKITDKYEEDKENHTYIEDMILRAKNDGNFIVVDALQWLRRGLHFVTQFFQKIIDDKTDKDDLSTLIRTAYEETLEIYHGWLGMQLFNILSRFVPSRRSLFYTLALEKHNEDQRVLNEMTLFAQRMTGWIEKLQNFYQYHSLETHRRV